VESANALTNRYYRRLMGSFGRPTTIRAQQIRGQDLDQLNAILTEGTDAYLFIPSPEVVDRVTAFKVERVTPYEGNESDRNQMTVSFADNCWPRRNVKFGDSVWVLYLPRS
jgi:hypothetical protein